MAYMQSQPMAHFRLLFLATCLFLSDHLNAQHMNAPDAPCQAPASNAERAPAVYLSFAIQADALAVKVTPHFGQRN